MAAILSINLDRRMSRMIELRDCIQQLKPMAICLQDCPNLGNQLLKDTIKIIAPNYSIIKNDITISQNNNQHYLNETITLINNRQCYIKRTIHSTSREANLNGVVLNVPKLYKTTNITLFNAYIRPRASFNKLEECLNHITANVITTRTDESSNNDLYTGFSKTIIVGDFNANSSTWTPLEQNISNNHSNSSSKHYDNIKRNRGKRINSFIKEHKLECISNLAEGPTFNSSNYKIESYLDICLVGNKLIRKQPTIKHLPLTNVANGTPMHKVIIVKLRDNTDNLTNNIDSNTVKTRIKYDFNKLTSDHYIALDINTKLTRSNWYTLPREQIIQKMNELTYELYKSLKGAQNSIRQITYERNQTKFKDTYLQLKARSCCDL